MITPEEIIHTFKRSHEAIIKLIEKGQKVEKYIKESHHTAIVGYQISVFTVEKHRKNEFKVYFNGVNLWVLLITSDADHNQMDEFKELCASIFLKLEKAYEEVNSDQYKFKELNDIIKGILTPINIREPQFPDDRIGMPSP